MNAKLKVAVIGGGQFSSSFIPLFKAHPGVAEVGLVEIDAGRLTSVGDEFGIKARFRSLAQFWSSDFDAVAIFTPRWTHGAIALDALRHGRHVYTSVPMGISIDEITAIVDFQKSSNLTYFMAETSYYYPAVVFSRQKYRSGEMGRFVYGEGEYLHDMSHGFYDAYAANGGSDWKSSASFPPMLYATHSVSAILSVTGASAISVNCLGIADADNDGVFDKEVSRWKNDQSNQVALFRTSDGGIMRIAEMRKIGTAPLEPTVRLSVFGTKGSFEQQVGYATWATLESFEIVTPDVITGSDVENPASLKPGFKSDIFWSGGFATVHDRSQLPSEFDGLSNGHGGSHQFMVDDFVMDALGKRKAPMNVLDAARFTAPGIAAYESAKNRGESVQVRQF